MWLKSLIFIQKLLGDYVILVAVCFQYKSQASLNFPHLHPKHVVRPCDNDNDKPPIRITKVINPRLFSIFLKLLYWLFFSSYRLFAAAIYFFSGRLKSLKADRTILKSLFSVPKYYRKICIRHPCYWSSSNFANHSVLTLFYRWSLLTLGLVFLNMVKVFFF